MEKGNTTIFTNQVRYFNKAHSIEGTLSLTQNALKFNADDQASDNKFDIELKNVQSLRCFKMYDVLPSGFELILEDGSIESFIVGNRTEWMSIVGRQIEKVDMVAV